MRYRIDQRFAQRLVRHEIMIFAVHAFIGLETPKALEPPHRAAYLIVQTTRSIRNHNRIGCTIFACVRNAYQLAIMRLRITLGNFPEGEHAIQRRMQGAPKRRKHPAVAKIIFFGGLGFALNVDLLRLQKRSKFLHIDMRRRSRLYRPLLG